MTTIDIHRNVKEMTAELLSLAKEKGGPLKAREITAEAIYIMQLIEDLVRTDVRRSQMDTETRGELQKSYKTCCELARKLPTIPPSEFWRK
jgi:hypothetical protein